MCIAVVGRMESMGGGGGWCGQGRVKSMKVLVSMKWLLGFCPLAFTFHGTSGARSSANNTSIGGVDAFDLKHFAEGLISVDLFSGTHRCGARTHSDGWWCVVGGGGWYVPGILC